jgi:hypothetical protein
MTARRALAPVRKTRMLPRITRAGKTRPECWEAVTVGPDGEPDGVWTFRRLDQPGTPWEAELMATGETVWCVSLDDCRASVADGSLMRLILARRSETPGTVAA